FVVRLLRAGPRAVQGQGRAVHRDRCGEHRGRARTDAGAQRSHLRAADLHWRAPPGRLRRYQRPGPQGRARSLAGRIGCRALTLITNDTEDQKMADEQTPAAANGADTQSQQPNLALQGVYLKDCSYEAPLGPRSEGNWQPQINLDLATTSNPIQGDTREVVLTVTVSAKQNDKTLFLVEVKQAGAFLMQNLSEDDTKRAIASICPGVLFPY